MRLVLIASLASVTVAIASSACTDKVTSAQCTALIDRLLDLKIDEDPRAKELSAAQRGEVRAAAKKEMTADPDVKQVQNDCEAEVTKAEYDCAVKAKTSTEWNACIQ